jgi:ectoine hydroxylase
MKTEDILATTPTVLSQAQREAYFEDGYLLLESFVSHDWLERLRAITDEFIEASRTLEKSTATFDLEAGHSAASPRLRRLCDPVEHHSVYWEFVSRGPIVDLAAELVGPDVKYHHSKLNFKWRDGGEEVKWHQDIQFWPHTNYSPLTIGVYLDDVSDDMAPMGVIPKSHDGELFDLYNDEDAWTGAIAERDLARVALDDAVFLAGPAGSVTIHNCRTIHGSMPNGSARSRALLLQTYTSADALKLTSLTDRLAHSNEIVRGKPARWIHSDPRPCLIPPDWSKEGYTSIFALQQEEGPGS